MLIFSWLFLVIYGLVVAALVFIFLRRWHRDEIDNRVATLIDLGRMCSDLAEAKEEAHKDSVRTAQLYDEEIAERGREIKLLKSKLQEANDLSDRVAFHVYAIRSLTPGQCLSRSSTSRLADLEHERLALAMSDKAS